MEVLGYYIQVFEIAGDKPGERRLQYVTLWMLQTVSQVIVRNCLSCNLKPPLQTGLWAVSYRQWALMSTDGP
jgi:hypothetical protein